jgi:hypothetical protein
MELDLFEVAARLALFARSVVHSNLRGPPIGARPSSLSREGCLWAGAGADAPDDWVALMRLSTTVRASFSANPVGMSRRHATVPRNSGVSLPVNKSLSSGRAVVKVICIIGPMWATLNGPLTKSSPTLFGSVISIGPFGDCITGMATSFLTLRTQIFSWEIKRRPLGSSSGAFNEKAFPFLLRLARSANVNCADWGA